MNRRAIRHGLAVLAWILTSQAGAFARCAPARDADLVAAGGAIVSGRIVAVEGPMPGAGDGFFEQARFEVTERRAGSAPGIVRLQAVQAGLYTIRFSVGAGATFAIRNPHGLSGVTMCDARGP
jgi:hypothetical protein